MFMVRASNQSFSLATFPLHLLDFTFVQIWNLRTKLGYRGNDIASHNVMNGRPPELYYVLQFDTKSFFHDREMFCVGDAR